ALIYRCQDGHVSFSKDLRHCGMKGCANPAEPVNNIDVEWFYKISPEGLAINEADLHMILKDNNMPKDVKKLVRQAFRHVSS
ncbi:MAG: hypothetical protein ACREAY_09165, partial [Nitrososphaera sp.]|uniref:hypothetical protein n=1 Tax=Nitrososphaera sp. TaxID=1971748 RepID=UPI003D6DE0DD